MENLINVNFCIESDYIVCLKTDDNRIISLETLRSKSAAIKSIKDRLKVTPKNNYVIVKRTILHKQI